MRKLLHKTKRFRISKWDVFFVFLFFVIAAYLMYHTFSTSKGNINIAAKVWSDFGATIPLMRSFSFGKNVPLEYPLFPGEHIRYHFVFFLAVGLLERIGFSLGFALNALSILAFGGLLTTIYLTATYVFKSRRVGIFSVILFLFNGSFSFLEFFKLHPLGIHTFSDIVKNNAFSSFGPYDGKIVSAFWNLNIYTNQRHLALAYCIFLVFALTLFYFKNHPKKFSWNYVVILGVALGFLPFVHMAVFGMIVIALGIQFLLYKGIRTRILALGFIAFCLSLPQLAYLRSGGQDVQYFHLGYLAQPLNTVTFAQYWFYNVGFSILIFPIAFFMANKNQKLFIVPFLALFVVGNMFQFTPEIAANHKFFNLFSLGLSMYCAFFLHKLLSNKYMFIFVIPIFIILTLSGFIDLFPIVNDAKIPLPDYPNDPTVNYIKEYTPPESVFLNSTYLYTPSSLAGRKIYMGWPYFAWSAGYDTRGRDLILAKLWNPESKEQACYLLQHEGIDYVEYHKIPTLEGTTLDISFYEHNFIKTYVSPQAETILFNVHTSCDTLNKTSSEIKL